MGSSFNNKNFSAVSFSPAKMFRTLQDIIIYYIPRQTTWRNNNIIKYVLYDVNAVSIITYK